MRKFIIKTWNDCVLDQKGSFIPKPDSKPRLFNSYDVCALRKMIGDNL